MECPRCYNSTTFNPTAFEEINKEGEATLIKCHICGLIDNYEAFKEGR